DRSGRLAENYGQGPDSENRRRMSPRLQIQAVGHDRHDGGDKRNGTHAIARIAQHQSENTRQPHAYESAVHRTRAIRNAFEDRYFTHVFAPGVEDLPENSL